MVHSYHDGLPGYDERQILHDGCHECEFRGKDIRYALNQMDNPTFTRTADRARDYYTGSSEQRDALNVSEAERPLLEVMGHILAHSTVR